MSGSAAEDAGRAGSFAPRAAVVAVAEVMREVVEVDLDPLAAEDLVGLLRGLDEAARLLEACRAKVLGVVDRTEAWRGQGRDASVAAWRSRTTRTGQGKAHREVNIARTLATTPGAAEALADGDMTLEHAEVFARTATSGGADRRAKVADAMADPEASGELLASAKHLDVPRFARAAEAWATRLDPLTLEADHAAQRRARYLTVADTPAGTFIKGRLDKMAGHRLRLALEATTRVPSADDTRDHGQRAADALDVLAQGALADPASRPGGHVPPQVSIIMTEQTLVGLRTLRDEVAPFDPATLEDGTPVPVSETERILCDAQFTRIVLDAESVPVDLGRTKRLWTGAQRRLVIARDRHCAFPSCQIPARWCEIHHIAWWARDRGATDIDNAVLLCTTHHGMVHAQNLTITREAAPPGPPGAGLPLVNYAISDPAGRSWSSRAVDPPRLGTAVPDLATPCDGAVARPSTHPDTRLPTSPPSKTPQLTTHH